MQYRRARKKFDEEVENHERWLISYADFITLLFAFFVVMYAISSVNIGKYKVFSDALGDAFGGAGASPPVNTQVPNLPIPNPALKRRTEMLRQERQEMTKLAQDLLSTLAPLVKEGKVRVTQNSRGVSVEINASCARWACCSRKIPITSRWKGIPTICRSAMRNSRRTGSCRRYAPAAWCGCLSTPAWRPRG
jgi:flagellar motor protein MotB